MGSLNTVDEHLPVCDFRAIGKKFDEGLYTSLVSVCTETQWLCSFTMLLEYLASHKVNKIVIYAWLWVITANQSQTWSLIYWKHL